MCRSHAEGGRRCPGDGHMTPEQRDARNARRRERYAKRAQLRHLASKFNDEEIKDLPRIEYLRDYLTLRNGHTPSETLLHSAVRWSTPSAEWIGDNLEELERWNELTRQTYWDEYGKKRFPRRRETAWVPTTYPELDMRAMHPWSFDMMVTRYAKDGEPFSFEDAKTLAAAHHHFLMKDNLPIATSKQWVDLVTEHGDIGRGHAEVLNALNRYTDMMDTMDPTDPDTKVFVHKVLDAVGDRDSAGNIAVVVRELETVERVREHLDVLGPRSFGLLCEDVHAKVSVADHVETVRGFREAGVPAVLAHTAALQNHYGSKPVSAESVLDGWNGVRDTDIPDELALSLMGIESDKAVKFISRYPKEAWGE